MRAAVKRGNRLVVDEVPDPVPGPGEALVRTIACGICGSDLHALVHMDRMVDVMRVGGLPARLDPSQDVVMGHEFAAEVLELGPDAFGVRPGDLVVCMPGVFADGEVELIGYSNTYPGGYGERMVLMAGLALRVPNGLDARRAALTEPMSVGMHAVQRSGIVERESALVIGCGPIGLAIVAALAVRGIEPIVASDFSARRRELAARMGAHVVNDPAQEPAIDAWTKADGLRTLVVFEAVGVPGILDRAMRDAPRGTRIIVAGVCMEPDTVQPMIGISKELDIRFCLGYEPVEFSETLRLIAEGTFDVAPMITGTVGIDGVPDAFEWLAEPDDHVKILVEP